MPFEGKQGQSMRLPMTASFFFFFFFSKKTFRRTHDVVEQRLGVHTDSNSFFPNVTWYSISPTHIWPAGKWGVWVAFFYLFFASMLLLKRKDKVVMLNPNLSDNYPHFLMLRTGSTEKHFHAKTWLELVCAGSLSTASQHSVCFSTGVPVSSQALSFVSLHSIVCCCLAALQTVRHFC